MGTMVGTVITVKELYGVKSADIQFRNGTNSTPLITLEENRKYIVPYFQREIRWTKDNLITLINDVRKGSKFLMVLPQWHLAKVHMQFINPASGTQMRILTGCLWKDTLIRKQDEVLLRII